MCLPFGPTTSSTSSSISSVKTPSPGTSRPGRPLSGAGRGPTAIAHYDAIRREPALAAAHRPQFVIRVGDLPTSKPVRLAGLDDVVQIAIGPDDAGRNPDSVVGMRVSAPYRTLLAGLTAGVVAAAGASGWRRGARRTTPPNVGIGENCLDDRFLVMSRRHWPYQLVVTGGHRIRKR